MVALKVPTENGRVPPKMMVGDFPFCVGGLWVLVKGRTGPPVSHTSGIWRSIRDPRLAAHLVAHEADGVHGQIQLVPRDEGRHAQEPHCT